jgi:hypothetical protein
MSDVSLPAVECLSPGLYTQRLTVASHAAVTNLLALMQRFIEQRPAKEPLYFLLDASSLDIAYTPRVRERLEHVISQIHYHHETIRIAFVLPHTMGNCAVFLNNMLRSRETSQMRHACFARRQDALLWLQELQRGESLPAAQGF